MKKFRNILSLCLALMMILTCIPAVHAAEAADAMIDEERLCSLTIWKYDWTAAVKDGVWNEDSFVSTGWRESYVEEVLGNAVRDGDANGNPDNPLGNGQSSNGYAIKGIEFSIVRVADIVTFSESANDGHPDYNLTQVLYGFEKESTADLLAAIGLANGEGRYENADHLGIPVIELDGDPDTQEESEGEYWFYQSDVINKALSAALAENPTIVKNALEAYVSANPDTIVMDETDENGKTIERDLSVGLWLCVETKTNEAVSVTTDPFFISLPMTTVSGNQHSSSVEGGHAWNYDVVTYPKNSTSIPSLTKEVREAKKDTGKHEGTAEITDGFSHNATASGGDVLEYQYVSTLPMITSKATALTTWQYYDTISEGISYNKSLKDVKIEIFTDKSCTDKVTEWVQDDGKFTVTYSSDDRTMTIAVTEAGLAEINGDLNNVNGPVYAGYSNYTMRVTYTATVNTDGSFITGADGNCNEVVLTWSRTNSSYYDTLIDDCHTYSFGMNLNKLFSDIDAESAEETGMYKHVKFKLWNESDGYWVIAKRDEATGIYYVTGHSTEEADATVFYPVTVNGVPGTIHVELMEDDYYNLIECETADGYTLLKDDIYVDIYAFEDNERMCDIYSKDVLGLLQNDPRYCWNLVPMSLSSDDVLHLTNIPQTELAHAKLNAYATVDMNDVTMLDDDGSVNALVPLTVVNTAGFDLPQTGDNGVALYAIIGITMMAGAALVILLAARKKKEQVQ